MCVCMYSEAWTKGKVGPIQFSWASPPPPLTLFMISPSTHQLSHEYYLYITVVEALLSKYACGSGSCYESTCKGKYGCINEFLNELVMYKNDSSEVREVGKPVLGNMRIALFFRRLVNAWMLMLLIIPMQPFHYLPTTLT